MAYCYDNLKLEKGMYHEAGRSFTQVLKESWRICPGAGI